MYQRSILKTLTKRLNEPRRFIQVMAGPRQVGKTTLARQVMPLVEGQVIYASADEPALRGTHWIEQQWDAARARLRAPDAPGRVVLVLDEIQKIPGWSETVKRLWDEDSFNSTQIQLLALGSSPLLVERGLSESLAGRFEVIRVPHWSYCEMRDAFGWDLDTFITFGGYPGSASLISEPSRWAAYIQDSLIETSIARDVLLMTRVDKPALLRSLFDLGCSYSGQVLSFQKMVGQLQDAGNTTTIAHYLELLGRAGLVTGLQKYAGERVRQRASSPKLLVLNTALLTASTRRPLDGATMDPEFRGRLVESAVGAHLATAFPPASAPASSAGSLQYWSSGNREVDFVLSRETAVTAIEVKSTRRRAIIPGVAAFEKEFGPVRKILVGGQGLALEEFFKTPPDVWLD